MTNHAEEAIAALRSAIGGALAQTLGPSEATTQLATTAAGAAFGALNDLGIMQRLADLDAVAELFAEGGLDMVAVRDHIEALYLITCNEDGGLFYVGIPFGDDEGAPEDAVDENRGLLESRAPGAGPTFPLTMLGGGLF